MASKAQRKDDVANLVANVAKELTTQIDKEVEVVDNGKMLKTNRKGEMLMCEFTLQKRPGQPDPLCITINDEVRWVKRGAKVIVPWYLVEHMLNNIERKFRQEKDQNGKNVVVFDDMTTEQFQYREIDPAEGCYVEGPKEQPVTTM